VDGADEYKNLYCIRASAPEPRRTRYHINETIPLEAEFVLYFGCNVCGPQFACLDENITPNFAGLELVAVVEVRCRQLPDEMSEVAEPHTVALCAVFFQEGFRQPKMALNDPGPIVVIIMYATDSDGHRTSRVVFDPGIGIFFAVRLREGKMNEVNASEYIGIHGLEGLPKSALKKQGIRSDGIQANRNSPLFCGFWKRFEK
jgi:hypothetical protein